MKFNFIARTKEGQIQTGIVEAQNKEAAIDILREQELYVSSLEEIYTPLYAKRLVLFERITNREIVLFARQIAILLKSQVPIPEALETLARQTKNRGFREKIQKIQEKIRAGTSLSEALSMYPKIFSHFFISMVRSAEASGKVADTLVYLADYLEKEYKFKAKLRGALTYPAFIVIVFIIVSVVMITYIIPHLSQVLKESKQELPLLTKFIMAFADFVKSWWWFILLLLITIIIFIIIFARTKKGKIFFDKFFLSFPVLNVFLKKIFLSRFALTLSTLIAGGIPIVKSLEITADIIGNKIYQDIINETRDQIRKGETISSVLERHPLYVFPLFSQMVAVGEKTGTLDTSLKNVVNFYEDDVNRALEDFIKLLEPLLIVLLGGVIALLIGAVLMPIYSVVM